MGRLLLGDDTGRDDGVIGFSGRKKLDLRLRGDGEGGIWDSVSIVLSDREGLGRRGSVRDLTERSGRTPVSVLDTDSAAAWDLVASE